MGYGRQKIEKNLPGRFEPEPGRNPGGLPVYTIFSIKKTPASTLCQA
jgi:hypothetical protein